MTRLIRIAIESWKAWWLKRRLYRENAELNHFDEQERKNKIEHKCNKAVVQARRDYMLALLRRQ